MHASCSLMPGCWRRMPDPHACQAHPAAALEAADTPAQALDVASHRRDVTGQAEAMQHQVAETLRECCRPGGAASASGAC